MVSPTLLRIVSAQCFGSVAIPDVAVDVADPVTDSPAGSRQSWISDMKETDCGVPLDSQRA